MNKPIDYPLNSPTEKRDQSVDSSDITYAVLRDRVENEKPVTDEMIRVARSKLDTAHINAKSRTTSNAKFKLPNIRNRFK